MRPISELSKRLIMVAVAVVVALGTGEALLRVKDIWWPKLYTSDTRLGWRSNENLSFTRSISDATGKETTASYSTNSLGFRAFGNLTTSRPKILFIGDSFTQDLHTSNEDAYFGVVRNLLPVEVFATGAGGYGSLQEYILLDYYVDKIKPDVFVLQFCSNDFENNSMALESSTIVRNQSYRRPYLAPDGKIQFRISSWHPYHLVDHLRLFALLDNLIARIQYNLHGKTFNTNILLKEDSPPELKQKWNESFEVTDRLLGMMKKRLPTHTIAMTFDCGARDKRLSQVWKQLANKNGFEVIPYVPEAAENLEDRGGVVRSYDHSHMNALGNRVAGGQIAAYIGWRLQLFGSK